MLTSLIIKKTQSKFSVIPFHPTEAGKNPGPWHRRGALRRETGPAATAMAGKREVCTPSEVTTLLLVCKRTHMLLMHFLSHPSR